MILSLLQKPNKSAFIDVSKYSTDTNQIQRKSFMLKGWITRMETSSLLQHEAQSTTTLLQILSWVH